MSDDSSEQSLRNLPCHFTWIEMADIPRTVEIKIENFEEHVQQTIQGTEVESYNLMGFYKAQNNSLIQATGYFNKALESAKTEDEKIVCLSCLAWLTWLERGWDCSVYEKINEVKKIIRERDAEDIPEVLTEKAFSIAQSGLNQRNHAEEAYRCIKKTLSTRPRNIKAKFIKGIVMKDLYKEKILPLSPLDNVELLEMKRNWSEIQETRHESKEFSSTIYVMSLIEYAFFLNKVQRDFGESGRKVAEEAERILQTSNSSVAIMRKLAEVYLFSAKHNTKILEKAECILDGILREKPDCYRTLLLRGRLFFDKYRFTAKENKEKYFNEAKTSFLKSWKSSRKTVVLPALDLVRIYQRKFEDTDDPQLLLDVENLFGEIHEDVDKLSSMCNALVHEAYGVFLKAHHKMLVLSHLKKSFEYRPVLEKQPKHPLWDLARELTLSLDLKEKREGTKTIEWMNDLLARRIPCSSCSN